MTVVLASASRARAGMLRAAGVEIEIDPARIDEDAVKQSMRAESAPARDIADKLAELKSLRGSSRHPGKFVLGADQVLAVGAQSFDKPGSVAAARAQLEQLRGQTHHLHSAAVIARDGMPVWRHIGTTRLTMRPFTDEFLETYLVQTGDLILETVGCYHLEGRGAQLFSRIEGDYFTVLGLPLIEVLGFLRAHGILPE